MKFHSFIIWVICMFVKVKLLNFPLERVPKIDTNATSAEEFYPYYFILNVGTPSKEIKLIFDTASHFTWISNNYNKTNSSTFIAEDKKEDTLYTISNSTIKAFKANDTVTLSTNFNFTFHFFFATQKTITYLNADGIAGFAMRYLPIEEKQNCNSLYYSFYHSVNNSTEMQVISLIHTEQNKGTLYINEYDSSIFNKEDTQYCLSKEDYNLWNCEMSFFAVDKTETTNKEIAVFATGEEFIYAPSESGKKVLTQYLNLINKKNNLCTIEDNMRLFCDKFDYDYLPDFAILLPDNTTTNTSTKIIRLTGIGEDMFKNYNSTHFLFKVIVNKNLNYWVIGEPIIKNYNFLFDYDNKVIGIVPYSKVGFFLLILFIMIGFSILIVFLGMVYNYNRNETIKGKMN